jgi:membrane-associated protease RseP (regulator of RpoE activity)
MNRLLRYSLGLSLGAAGFAAEGAVSPAQLPPVEVASTSLELGAQFNPFVNTFTKRLKYLNVSRVKEGSVAARAGLRNGDRIVALNGLSLADYKIADFPDIRLRAVDRRVTVPLKAERKTESHPLDLTLVFADFEGGVFQWSIRHSTLQKLRMPDDWHLDPSRRAPPR